jgi:putative ABC transport system permease protein
VAIVGIVFAFVLTTAQSGLLVGWCNTVSAIVRHCDADFWIMAPKTQSFDFPSQISRSNVFLARSVNGVTWAEGLILDWNTWLRSDGREITLQILGLDDSCAGGPWIMKEGKVTDAFLPRAIIVDESFLDLLGVSRIGDEVEIWDHKAVVRGICSGIRTFTTNPVAFTSRRTLTGWDPRLTEDSITFVLVRKAPDASQTEVLRRLQESVPYLQVLTTRQFAIRTIKYWMLTTGAGITVVMIAILGLIVGSVIISQTLYATTLDHITDYATLLALGFAKARLASVVVIQSSLVFFYLARLSASTPLPLETTPAIFAGLVLLTLLCCVLASFMSVRSIFRLDPVTVFKR